MHSEGIIHRVIVCTAGGPRPRLTPGLDRFDHGMLDNFWKDVDNFERLLRHLHARCELVTQRPEEAISKYRDGQLE